MRNIKRFLSVMLLLCLFGGFAAAETAKDPASVTYLDFGARWIHNMDYIIGEIEKYPNLERVDMYGTPVGIINMGKLSERFPNITFGWTIRFKEHSIRSDSTAVSTQHNYNSLRHLTRQVALLRYCRQLKALDLEYNNCDDLWFIPELKDLRVLIFASNLITDVSPLAGMTKLEYLDLSGNQITDIAPLTGLTRLMDLNLSNNRIDDLTPLAKMTWLKRLWLYNATGSQVSEETLQLLKKALPDTEIVCESSQDSWKKHPHYDVIRTMFRMKREYIPFEDSCPDE